MCRWLNLPRSSYYYKTSEPVSEADLEEKVKQIFPYGARKIAMSGYRWDYLYLVAAFVES